MNDPLQTAVCIVGGGPAGIVLALLLARQGIDVTVLEKHKDFNRDFRGDTIHAATLRVMRELGLLEALLQLPHRRFERFQASLGGRTYTIADFTTLPPPTNFIALMPQWDLLNFLAAETHKYPNARILMEHKVTGLLQDPSPSPSHPARILGARAETPAGPVEIHAALTVGCDGRHAITTDSAHLTRIERGAPIDVLWFRLSRRPGDPENALGNLNYGRMVLLIDRGDYFQCGYIIAKDSFINEIQPTGLDTFRQSIARIVPFLGTPSADLGSEIPARVDEIQSWDQISLLSVQVNRLRRWHLPGLLCIGDAARILTPVLRTAQERGTPVTERAGARVQHRRSLPTRISQGFQVIIHSFLKSYLGNPAPLKAPLSIRVLSRSSLFHRAIARFIAIGIRPEHIR